MPFLYDTSELMLAYNAKPKKTSLPLNLVIVGGGIGGLACAYCLQKQGHKVVVLEQSDGEFRSRGYIPSPPNMTRLLNDEGCGSILDRIAVKSSGLSFKIGATGEEASVLRFHPQIMTDLAADFLYIQHGDLYTLLYDLACGVGTDVRFNSKVVRVDPERAAAILNTGEQVSGDLLIGADGSHSLVREAIVGGPIKTTADQRCLISFALPIEKVREDKDLRALAESRDWAIWMGNGCVAYGCVTRNGQEYAVKIVGSSECVTPTHPDWKGQRPKAEIKMPCMAGFEPRVHKLFELTSTVTLTTDTVMEPFDTWVHDSGKVVLMGDAAHPLIPSGSHHVAMAVEDAVTLSGLLHHLTAKIQLPRILSAFEEIRLPRCSMVRTSELGKREFVTLSHRSEAESRDQQLLANKSRALKEWHEADEDYLAGQWGEYLQMFGHDASEQVDDWYSKWGMMMARNGTANGR